MTNLERVRRYRQKEMKKGRKFISFLLSLEATKKLNDIQGRTGESQSGIVERLLLGKAPAAPGSQTLDRETISKIRTGKKPAAEKEVKNLITELRINERLSHKQIAEYLLNKKVPTISGRGTWQQGSVGKLLKKWGVP